MGTKKKDNKRGKLWAVVSALMFVAIVGIIISALNIRGQIEAEEGYRLSEDLYLDAGEVAEISTSEYNELVNNQKTFLLLGHMFYCPAGMPLTELTGELSRKYNIRIYSMGQEDFFASPLAEKIKYLPTMVILHNGKMVDYLDAEKDEDIDAYKTLDGLENWVKKYIRL